MAPPETHTEFLNHCSKTEQQPPATSMTAFTTRTWNKALERNEQFQRLTCLIGVPVLPLQFHGTWAPSASLVDIKH